MGCFVSVFIALVVAILTDGQTQDVLRGGQGEAEAPCVGADFLFTQTARHCVSVLVKSVYISKTLKLLQPKQTGILKQMRATGGGGEGGKGAGCCTQSKTETNRGTDRQKQTG